MIEDWSWASNSDSDRPDHPWYGEVPLVQLIAEILEAAGNREKLLLERIRTAIADHEMPDKEMIERLKMFGGAEQELLERESHGWRLSEPEKRLIEWLKLVRSQGQEVTRDAEPTQSSRTLIESVTIFPELVAVERGEVEAAELGQFTLDRFIMRRSCDSELMPGRAN
jgi:hypothetical protein